ncbi:MAG: response regulator [Cytophaga sp.]|uniref:response regulator n=1 Tax=Cytophaga sp. TaxID=29535 RepID=UPI003F7EA87A
MCRSKNIYLADDDEDDRSFFQDALKEVCKEYTLTTAADGRELMEILYTPPVRLPDIIFLDLNMPAKNGFECLTEIKKNTALKRLPIIIFSTTAQEEAVNKAYENGASYYICKPNSFSLLKKTLKKVLEIDWINEVNQISKEKFIVSVA